MSRCDININFDKSDRIFTVGEDVSGNVSITASKATVCHGVHIMWQWRTHGRGNTAKGKPSEVTHHVSGDELDEGKEYSFPFNFPAPNGPLTYRGHYLNVDWYLRARVDARGPFDPKQEEEFLLLPTIGKEISLGPNYSPNNGSENKMTSGCSTILSFGFLAFGLLWVVITFLADAPLFPKLLGLPFIALGIFFVYKSLRNSLALNKLGEVRVVLAENDFVPGEVLSCQVTFTPKTAIDLKHISYTLKGKEQVISGSGTNKTTHTHKLSEKQEIQLENSRFKVGEKVESKAAINIPEDAAYTFMATDNKLFWALEVVVDAKGWPNWVKSYPITVQPWKS